MCSKQLCLNCPQMSYKITPKRIHLVRKYKLNPFNNVTKSKRFSCHDDQSITKSSLFVNHLSMR